MLALRPRRWPNIEAALGECKVFAERLLLRLLRLCQRKRTKFGRFVDLDLRGAQRRVYSDLRIYCN